MKHRLCGQRIPGGELDRAYRSPHTPTDPAVSSKSVSTVAPRKAPPA
jgi:hypothetical protein